MEYGINVDELLKILSQKKIIIYGIGHVGMKFFYALKKHRLEKNIISFAVSTPLEGQSNIDGIPIRSIEELDNQESVIVCIAVHEAWKEKIAHKLKIVEYIWIYPFLYELLLGHPIELDVNVDLNRMIKTCMGDYRLAVRYMAIEQYFKKNKVGYDIYIKAASLYCDKRTAEERLLKFIELVHNWEHFGYDKSSQVLINTQYEIIDGTHRIATARYFGQKKIICNIFSNELPITKLHGEKAMLTEKVLKDGGFCSEEREELDIRNKIIRGE